MKIETIRGRSVRLALAVLLESEYSLASVKSSFTYARVHDGIDGEKDDKNDPAHSLSLFMVGYGEVCIIIPPKKKHDEWRFRNRVGGGQSERVRRALIVLMEAIRRDNLKEPFYNTGCYKEREVAEALNFVLEDKYWIDSIDVSELYTCQHDDAEGSDEDSNNFSLAVDFTGDVHIVIHAGKFRTLRFRHPFSGGKSERVRKALIILMESIRRDNEKNPEP